MKAFEFTININARPEKVEAIMLGPETYKEWVGVSWPGSTYEGSWQLGEDLKFAAPGQGGTLATIEVFKPHAYIQAKHIAVVNADGSLDKESDIAKGWIGTTESYTFTEQNGGTELKVQMVTKPEWGKMFTDSMPRALDKLKELCEA